jgi:hypothetical protein
MRPRYSSNLPVIGTIGLRCRRADDHNSSLEKVKRNSGLANSKCEEWTKRAKYLHARPRSGCERGFCPCARPPQLACNSAPASSFAKNPTAMRVYSSRTVTTAVCPTRNGCFSLPRFSRMRTGIAD